MILKTHFELGQKVWCLRHQDKTVYDKCPSCDGGIIVLKDRSIDCPSCNGKGVLARKVFNNYMVGQPLTIGQLRFEVESEKYIEQYMCNETGVGSGTLHNAHDLFSSPESAQQEVDKRNNSDKKTWCCISCNPQFEGIGYGNDSEWRFCTIHNTSTRHADLKAGNEWVIEKQRRADGGKF